MHACYWYIVVCYDKLSIQQCLCIENAAKLNLKGVSVETPETHLDPPLQTCYNFIEKVITL